MQGVKFFIIVTYLIVKNFKTKILTENNKIWIFKNKLKQFFSGESQN